MAAKVNSNSLSRSEIRNLVEGIQKSNRADVMAFSSGHLNENNLHKIPIEKPGGFTWASAENTKENSKIAIPPLQDSFSSPRSKKAAQMTDTLQYFSLGTSGTVLPYTSLPGTKGSKGPVHVDRCVSVSSQGSYGEMDDGVLIEELGNAETMISNTRYKTKPWAYEDLAGLRDSTPSRLSQAAIRDANLQNLRQSFVPSHMMGVTKKDQFMRMKKFESEVVQKEDLFEQNSLTAARAVEHLEDKLQKALGNLEYNSYGPNFHRLQIYSDVFEDLIEGSSTFKYILGMLKKEYDDYIASLLDQQPSRHKLLQDQVEQLTARGTSDLSTLRQEQHNLNALEEEARAVLEENERLKRELEDERHSADDEVDPEELEMGPGETSEPVDLAEKIEDVRHQILEKLDQLNELRLTLRTNFVPATVVTHLEQCIKETEVEMQRYLSQKDFYERNIAELETDLISAIRQADTTDKDSKKIWNKVNAINDLSEDQEEEEEYKWDWYIS